MRWAITGSQGQLGRALQRALKARGEEFTAWSHAEFDLTEPGAARARLERLRPRPVRVVNAAAFTHVDRCEREPEMALRVNAVAPGLLAEACAELGLPLVHVSTDYVFPGDGGGRPYREDDAPDPRSVYGRTKLQGERSVLDASAQNLVVRTSWVFGEGRNFVAAILAQARARREGGASGPLRVVDDQWGRPTYAGDLAEGILGLVEAGARGLYHLAGAEVATWWDLARACLDESGFADLEVERIRTDTLKVDAPRPAWSVLDCSRAAALGVALRPWREGLQAYLHSDASPLAARLGA